MAAASMVRTRHPPLRARSGRARSSSLKPRFASSSSARRSAVSEPIMSRRSSTSQSRWTDSEGDESVGGLLFIISYQD